jgi:hypothetical protein
MKITTVIIIFIILILSQVNNADVTEWICKDKIESFNRCQRELISTGSDFQNCKRELTNKGSDFQNCTLKISKHESEIKLCQSKLSSKTVQEEICQKNLVETNLSKEKCENNLNHQDTFFKSREQVFDNREENLAMREKIQVDSIKSIEKQLSELDVSIFEFSQKRIGGKWYPISNFLFQMFMLFLICFSLKLFHDWRIMRKKISIQEKTIFYLQDQAKSHVCKQPNDFEIESSRNEELKRELKNQKKIESEKDEKLSKLEKKIVRIIEMEAKLKNELAVNKNELIVNKNELGSKIKSLEKEIKELNSEIIIRNRTILEKDQIISTFEGKLEKLGKKKTQTEVNFKDELDETKAELSQFGAKIKSLEKEIKQLNSNIENQKKIAFGKDQTISKLEGKVEILEKENIEIEENLKNELESKKEFGKYLHGKDQTILNLERKLERIKFEYEMQVTDLMKKNSVLLQRYSILDEELKKNQQKSFKPDYGFIGSASPKKEVKFVGAELRERDQWKVKSKLEKRFSKEDFLDLLNHIWMDKKEDTNMMKKTIHLIKEITDLNTLFLEYLLKKIELKFNRDWEIIMCNPGNEEFTIRFSYFFYILGDLWKIRILDDDNFKGKVNRVMNEFFILHSIYKKYGELMCERIPNEVEFHFRHIEQLERNCLKENNLGILEKIEDLKKFKKMKKFK